MQKRQTGDKQLLQTVNKRHTHVYCVCIHNSVVRTKCYSLVSRNETKQKMRCLILFLLLQSSKWNLCRPQVRIGRSDDCAQLHSPFYRLLPSCLSQSHIYSQRETMNNESAAAGCDSRKCQILCLPRQQRERVRESLFFSSSQLYSYSTNPQQRPQTPFIVQ